MLRFKSEDILKKPIKRWTRSALIATPIVIILVVLLVLHPWSTSLGPGRLIAKAYAATTELQSYRMLGSFFSTIEGKAVEQFCAWDFAFPDHYHGKLTLDDETYEFIIVGDKQYTRQPGGAQSGKMYAISLSGGIPTKEDTLKLLGSLIDLDKLPDEKIEGVDCIHYWGMVDVDRMIEEQKAKLDPRQPHYQEMLKGLEDMRGMKVQVELWIGKEDYLIRQLRQNIEVPLEGTSRIMMKYYDFNEPITIEPPTTASGELLPGWRLVSSPSVSGSLRELTFSRDVTFTIGGDDPSHQQISFRIVITNIGEEVASNVRVTLSTMATNEESRSVTIEAEPSTPGPVDLEPGESETYHVTWEYDASGISKEELTRLVDLTTVLAKYSDPDGNEAVQLLFPDVPYPSKMPAE